MDIVTFLFLVIIGSLTGFLAGTLGIGGGVIVVPSLYWLLSYQKNPSAFLVAVTTSLAMMIFTTASSSLTHGIKKAIHYKAGLFLILGAFFGAALSPMLALKLNPKILKISFALLEIFIACYLLFFKKPSFSENKNLKQFEAPLLVFAGLFIGFLSAMLGIGGGFLVTPLLIALGKPAKTAIATASFFALSMAIVASFSYYYFSGLDESLLNPYYVITLATASLLSAPFGAHVCHKLNEKLLKNIFCFFLMLAGLSVLIS